MSVELFLLEPYFNKEIFSFVRISIDEKIEWRLYIDGVLVTGQLVGYHRLDPRPRYLSFEEFYNYIFNWSLA